MPAYSIGNGVTAGTLYQHAVSGANGTWSESRLEEPLLSMFGNGPCQGEIPAVAIFGFADTAARNAEEAEDFVRRFEQAVNNVDVSDRNQVELLLTEFGCFSAEYSLVTIVPSYAAVEAAAYFRNLINDSVSCVEPLWIVVRKLVLYRLAVQLFELIRKRDFRAIMDIAYKTEGTLPTKDTWIVSFIPPDTPIPVLRGLTETRRLQVELEWEPTSPRHYLVAAQMLLARTIKDGLSAGLIVGAVPCIRDYDAQAIPRTAKGKLLLNGTHRMAASSIGESSPVLAHEYSARSREQFLYLQLMEKAVQPTRLKHCENESCGKLFAVEHARQKYCSDCRGKSPGQAQVRRQQRQRKAGEKKPERGR